MKKNEGYLLVEGVKEYLKLRRDQLNQNIFPDRPDFEKEFNNCFDQLYDLVTDCFKILATTTLPDGSPFIKEELTKAVSEKMRQRSSISVIHYFPRPKPTEEISSTPSIYDEEGMNNPSKIHTDTGILTFILCSDVPGLQIENRQKKDFIPIETLNTPKRDLFLYIRKKNGNFCKYEERGRYYL